MSTEGQGVRVSLANPEEMVAGVAQALATEGVELTVKMDPAPIVPLLNAQTDDILARMPAAQSNEAAFQQVRSDIADIPQLVADAIPAPVSIQPLLDAQRDQILSGIPDTPSNTAAFAQVRSDIAQLQQAVGAIVIPQPAPDLTPDVNEIKGTQLAHGQMLTAILIALGTALPNMPPQVNLTATVMDGAAPGRVQLSALASDPDGSIVYAEFYRNGVLLPNGTVTTRTAGAFVYVDTGLIAGAYGYTVKVFDNANASMTSSVSSVSISPAIVQPPAPGPDFPLTVSALALTDPGAILLTASPPTVTTRRVEFLKDGEIVAIWTAYSPEYQLHTPVTCSQSGMTPGTYNYQSKAYNANGAITVSAQVPVTIAARIGPWQWDSNIVRPIGPYDPNAPVPAIPPQAPGLPGDIVLPIPVQMIPLI